jgi:hypothetical protein
MDRHFWQEQGNKKYEIYIVILKSAYKYAYIV